VKIKVTGRHSDVSGPMKDYALEKVERLDRFFDRIHSVDLTLNVEGERHVAEIRIAVPGDTLLGSEESEDMYSSIDSLIDTIGRQLRKYKGKLRDKRGLPQETPASNEDNEEDEETFEDVVNRMAGE